MSFVTCIHGRNVDFNGDNQYCEACRTGINWYTRIRMRMADRRLPLRHLASTIATVRVVRAILEA